MEVGDRTPAIEARDLYRFFHALEDETFALRGVSLSLGEGEMVALVGPSGSGKSTLLSCLAGLDEPDGGHVEVGGTRITRRPEPERAAIRAASIGILLQYGNLLEHLTVAENVRIARSFSTKAKEELGDLLDELGIGERRDARPSTLSGGEAARAGLAVALANDPAIVLADEPTGELDREHADVVLDLLRARRERGTAVLVATHSDAVAAAADRVVTLADGMVVG
jgi:putative ABC transport system ATP-binding protein